MIKYFYGSNKDWISLSNTANRQIENLYKNKTSSWIASEDFLGPFYIDIINEKLLYDGYSYTLKNIK